MNLLFLKKSFPHLWSTLLHISRNKLLLRLLSSIKIVEMKIDAFAKKKTRLIKLSNLNALDVRWRSSVAWTCWLIIIAFNHKKLSRWRNPFRSLEKLLFLLSFIRKIANRHESTIKEISFGAWKISSKFNWRRAEFFITKKNCCDRKHVIWTSDRKRFTGDRNRSFSKPIFQCWGWLIERFRGFAVFLFFANRVDVETSTKRRLTSTIY